MSVKRGCLDPGHGGRDPGAVGPTGLLEKDVTLDVALIAAQILRNAGCQIKLTRESDNCPWNDDNDLSMRAQISRDFGAEFFVSIHANAAVNPAGVGMEIYTTKSQDASDALASCIADSMINMFNTMVFRADTSDGDLDKEADFTVIFRAGVPAALVEMAFISNPHEEALLKTPAFRQNMALAIAQGIGAWGGFPVGASIADELIEAVTKLQLKGIIASPDYWVANARPGQVCKGEWVALLMQNFATVKSGQQANTLLEAVNILQQHGIIVSPDYWLANAVPGGTCKGEYMAMLIKNFANKL